jgi:molybdate transport system ATP-binding protein
VTLAAHLQLTLGTLQLDVELDAAAGEVVAVLGPNGAGKTTALRALAGLHGIDAGRIAIDGRPVDDPAAQVFVWPEQRPLGVVFQDYFLFPHLTVLENVAFGPRATGTSKAEARARARTWLDRVGIAELAGRRPRAISGGQAQRAALARALATEPRVLLLDEPLAALDAGTRTSVRRDLHRHLTSFDGATVLVTHDPLDALALADRVVILEAGTVTQAGPIAEVTTRPRSSYVADLVGVNLLRGHARDTVVQLHDQAGQVVSAEPAQGPVLVLIEPRSVGLHLAPPEGSARNRWSGRVAGFDLLGERVRVRLAGAVPLVAEVTPAAVAELALTEGSEVWATVKATDVAVYPE